MNIVLNEDNFVKMLEIIDFEPLEWWAYMHIERFDMIVVYQVLLGADSKEIKFFYNMFFGKGKSSTELCYFWDRFDENSVEKSAFEIFYRFKVDIEGRVFHDLLERAGINEDDLLDEESLEVPRTTLKEYLIDQVKYTKTSPYGFFFKRALTNLFPDDGKQYSATKPVTKQSEEKTNNTLKRIITILMIKLYQNDDKEDIHTIYKVLNGKHKDKKNLHCLSDLLSLAEDYDIRITDKTLKKHIHDSLNLDYGAFLEKNK